MATNGYVTVKVKPGSRLDIGNGYAYEHRIVAEEKIGRRLKRGEQVHHINGFKKDNRPENLEVCKSVAQHRFKHRKTHSNLMYPGQCNPLIKCKCGCGKTMRRFDIHGRPRKYAWGHNPEPAEARTAVITAINSGATTIGEICRITNRKIRPTTVLVSKLTKEGLIKRIMIGVYGRKN